MTNELQGFLVHISVYVTAVDLDQVDMIVGRALDECPFETLSWTTTPDAEEIDKHVR